MYSKKYTECEITLQLSQYWKILNWIAYVAAISALWFVTSALIMKLLLLVIIGMIFAFSNTYKVDGLLLRANKWYVLSDLQQLRAQLLPGCYISAYLLVLFFKVDHTKRRVVIFRDAVSAEEFRWLRIYLVHR